MALSRSERPSARALVLAQGLREQLDAYITRDGEWDTESQANECILIFLRRELAKRDARVKRIVMDYSKEYGRAIYGQGSGIDIGIRSACKGILAALQGDV